MTRTELRQFAFTFAQVDDGSVEEARIDLFLNQAAGAFARDVGGVRGEVTITGTSDVTRAYDLPAGVNRIVSAYFLDDQQQPLVEGDTTNGFGLNVMRDPDFHSAGSIPYYYVLEQRRPPRVWFDSPVPQNRMVELVVTLNAITFGAGGDDEPDLATVYHEALGYYTAAYLARAMRETSLSDSLMKDYGNLVSRYQQERATREPAGMTVRPPPGFPMGGVGGSFRIVGGLGGEVSKETVLGFLQQIIEEGANVDITVDPATQRLTISVPVAGMTQAQQDTLEGAVQLDSIRLSDRDIVFGTDGGTERSITTPGVEFSNQGGVLGEITQLRVTGAGQTASRVGDEGVIDIPAATPGSGGLSGTQVDARIANNPKVQSFEHFENGLRQDTDLLTAVSFTVPAGGLSAALQVGADGLVPVDENDRELIVSLPGVAATRVQMKVFLAKVQAASAATLTDANSVSFTSGGSPSVTFRLARNPDGRFLVTADTAGTYSLTVKDSRIDLEGFARKSSTERVPDAKLPPLTTPSQVDAKIAAATETLDDFEESLRKVTEISDGDTVAIALSGTSYRISPAHPRVPSPDEPDRKLRVAASSSAIDSAELAAATHTFLLKDLLAKPAASVYNVPMSGANALVFQSKEGERMYLGRHSGGEFLVGTDQPGVTYHVYIWDDRVDVRTEARHNGTLETLIRDEIGAHDAGGQTGAQVDARIAPWARAGAPKDVRVPDYRLSEELEYVIEAVDVEGWDVAPADEARVATTFQSGIPTLAQAQALTYTSPTVLDVSPRMTNVYAIMRFTADANNEKAKFTLVRESASDTNPLRMDLGSSATVGVGGGFVYLALLIADIPVGATVQLQKHGDTHIDRSKLDTGVPVGSAADDGKVLTRRPDGPTWEELRRLHGLKVLHDSSIIGWTITALNASRAYAALAQFSPVFDLDDDGNGTGEFHVELVLHAQNRSSGDIGFGNSGADTDVRVAGFIVVRDLKNASDFLVAGLVGAQVVAEANLNKGAAKQGTIRLYFGRDANNQVGYFLNYTPESGADNTSSVSITARLEVNFLPADTGAGASTSGKGRLIATATLPSTTVAAGTFVSAARWAVESFFSGTAADKYEVNANANLSVPQSLPGNQPGFFLEVKVSASIISSFFLPWGALEVGTDWTAGGNVQGGRAISVPRDSTGRAINMILQRNIEAGRKDAIYFNGAGDALGANVTIEFYEWVV